MFHEDVVQVVRKRLEQEEDLPEERRPTALARSYYLKVKESEIFRIISEYVHLQNELRMFYNYVSASKHL